MQNKNVGSNSDISILGEYIFVDILSRLSVKTLLLLKCVCKPWCTLISTPWFISVHLKRLMTSDPDDHYVLVQSRQTSGLIPIRKPSCLIKLTEPYSSGYSVVGSVNGLVCLSTTDRKMICLWNPSIKQSKLLPMAHYVKTHKCFVSLGFGYEKSSDDYKIIKILNYGEERRSVVEVYSTKLDSWREVKTDIYLDVFLLNCCAIVEGFTCWVIRNEHRKRDLALFDLRREMFSIIPAPEVVETESQGFSAINYHDSLALLAYYSDCESDRSTLEIWMIEGGTYGEGLWQKTFTFALGFDVFTFWVLNNGDIVVENDPDMPIHLKKEPDMPFLFNLQTKHRRALGIYFVDSAFYYRESLVSIEGFKPCA